MPKTNTPKTNTTKPDAPKGTEYVDRPEPRREIKVLTVNDMLQELRAAKKNGLGNKKILLSDDDEGNGYHLCFYALSPTEKIVDYANLPFGVTKEEAKKEYIILG